MAKAAGPLANLRFVWVGDGPQRAGYERQLGQLGIRPLVRLAGLVPPSEVARMLSGMDVLVHASQWEGLPRAAVQALLMAKPVISFEIDGAPEVVLPGKTGMLVPFNDIGALARAIVRLASDADMRNRMGQAGRQRCLELFDHNRMVEAIESLYAKLAERRG
jgi:glycosyltransferase involved in cell wall biosynthesis